MIKRPCPDSCGFWSALDGCLRDEGCLAEEDVDEPDEFEPGLDGCSHGVGFDEDCDYCEAEMLEELIAERLAEKRKRQPDMFEGSGSDSDGGNNG